jgi:hypothetical protein
MKSRLRPFMWVVRITGVLILTFGMYSPVLADDDPDLAITKVHTGDFTQGDVNKTYTITVTNSGLGNTSGLITLEDTIPTGLIPQTISGSGWTCPTGDISASAILTCTLNTPILSGDSTIITLTVDVAVDAGDVSTDFVVPDPPNSDDTLNTYFKTVTNTVTVSGGGDLDGIGGNNTDDDVTRIIQKPDLRITGWQFRNEDKTLMTTDPQPNESFWIRMTIENRGGADIGGIYPGVFLDEKPNYGVDHSDAPLFLGQVTKFSDYRITPSGSINDKGCLYYDPAADGLIDPQTVEVVTERGNYSLKEFIPEIPSKGSATVDVHIDYTDLVLFNDPIYDTDGVRHGLKAGSYNIYLYADPSCLGREESFEDNNSFGPITVGISDTTPPSVSSSVRVNANPTGLISVDFTVTFSEIVTGVGPGDFALTTTGVSSATVSGVSGSGSSYTVSVNTGSGNGTIRLDVVDDDSIMDSSLNPLSAGFTTGEIYTVTKIIPPPTTLVNSVLPTSRSIPVGTLATIFNTVINAGPNMAAGVTLSINPAPAGTFVYQQTSCATNAIIGSPNPSLDLNPGEVLCYVLSFTPSATFAATNVHIQAQALNAPSTNLLTGINTWLLRSTAVAGPDMIALTTTTDFHQVACSGTNAFAVAISNVGAAATGDITATANTGTATLPLTISITETDPATGVILGDHILQSVGAGENRTVAVFVTFNGCVSFDPAVNRIFIEFRDASNNVVGSTSTAISTNR